jgi:nucleotidyltransferase substrate binding protein (TIGR01987 family)
MGNRDIRWIQRYSNFKRAFSRLDEAMSMSSLTELERDGLVQRFEFTLEIGWKVLKDFLEDQGFDFTPSPKETFRQAQAAEYIDFAQALIDGLEMRNILSHDYSGEKFETSEKTLREIVFPALQKLNSFFKVQAENENPL